MSYTPTTAFNFPGGDYTPGAAFEFNPAQASEFNAALDNLSGNIDGELATAATINQQLNGVGGVFAVESAVLKGALGAVLDDAGGQFQSGIAIQGELNPATAVYYTPATTFEFSAGNYQPGNHFVFQTGLIIKPLDSISGGFTTHHFDNQTAFDTGLDTLSGGFNARQAQNQSAFSGQLSINGAFIADISIAARFNATTDSLSGGLSGYYIQNRTQLNAALDAIGGGFNTINAPQAQLSATLTGIDGAAIGFIALEATLNTTLDGAGGPVPVNLVDHQAILAATLDGAGGLIDTQFDYNIHRFTLNQFIADQQGSAPVASKTGLKQNAAQAITEQNHSEQMPARAQTDETHAAFDSIQSAMTITAAASKDGTTLNHKTRAGFDVLTLLNPATCADTDMATQQNQQSIAVMEQMTPIRTGDLFITAQDTGVTVKRELLTRHLDDINPYTPQPDFDLSHGDPTTNFIFDVTLTPVDFIKNEFLGIVSTGVGGTWQHAKLIRPKSCSTVEGAKPPDPGVSPWIDAPRPPPPEPPPGHEPYVIPNRTTYFMQHNLSVTLIDLTPVGMSSVNLSFDADSFAWKFSGQLINKNDVALVKQTGAEPVELVITINGCPWHVFVENIERTRQFGKSVIQLNGRGLSSLLGNPHQQPGSATQAGVLTNQQIAEMITPAGWTIDWQMPTWLVSDGAYTHSNRTPIQALNDIARDIGGILKPSRTNKTITVAPRYPALPWNFDATAADVVIPESVILSLTERPAFPAIINGVYIHGSEIGGQLGWCRLNGTAGDRLAQTISNNLMTDTTGIRSLGERTLAGHYTQPAIKSMTLPLDGVDVPLLEIGQLIETTLDSETVKGIINSISISATLAKVRQTIQIGEETNNTWRQFKELLPSDPILVANLDSTDGTTSIMTLLDGGVIRVRGAGTVNQNYYIRSGKIEDQAPNMTATEIVI